ncbi:hypothetical protein A4U60_26405 [Priestia endophytica]|nr:hypothetical protein A4U60_26405 [Priestia endophytica]
MKELKRSIPKDIITAGCARTVSLKSDGTVIAVGDNEYVQCDVMGYTKKQHTLTYSWGYALYIP